MKARGVTAVNARFYLPGARRFANADTIVPDPANPQSFNRYSYVYNNPVKYLDPTGHCSGAPNDPNNPDFGCWFLQGQIQDTYQLSLTGDWLLDELQILLLAIGDMEAGLGGKEFFIAAFGGTKIHRAQGTWTGPGNVPANFIFKMTLWDAAFDKPLAATQWLILHEFGHTWDADEWLLTSLRLETEMGASSCLLEFFTSCGYTVSSGKPAVSNYAEKSNRRDDWAESWAAYLFRGSWPSLIQSGLHGIDPAALTTAQDRLNFVEGEIQYFQEFQDGLWSYDPISPFLGVSP